jgi:beta-glucosidase
MRFLRSKAVLWGGVILLAVACSEEEPIYKDPDASVRARVEDLLPRMTTEEKFFQLFMIPGDMGLGKDRLKYGIFGLQTSATARQSGESGQMMDYNTAGSAALTAEKINELQAFFLEETRLGIPIIPFDEALHGLVREGATAFPQAIGLAATWNTDLMSEVAAAIAEETRSRGIRQVLSPVVNIARDPRWGRVEETYGEDHYLSGRMGTAFVREFETRGIITTPKHFVANFGDGGRDSYPRYVAERELEEVYFPAFKACFGPGGSRSVMTSYNSLNGRPCTAHDWLLNKKLKAEWDFDGFVISDAGAVGGLLDLHHIVEDREGSAKAAIENGLDVIFQTDYSHHIPLLQAFASGMIDPEAIDEAVSRVLKAKFELGLFDDPFVDPGKADAINGSLSHLDLARKAARESIVLLKNENRALPMNAETGTVLVVGSDAVEARLGGYSGPGENPVSILDGIRAAVPETCRVIYSSGVPRKPDSPTTIPETWLSFSTGPIGPQNGLHAAYYSNPDFEGEPVMERTDTRVDFSWTLFPPDPSLKVDWYSVRWEGILKAPRTGVIDIGVEANDGFRLIVNDELVIDRWAKQSYGVYTVPYTFVAGRGYQIRLEFYETAGNGRVRLLWDLDQGAQSLQAIREAGNQAAQADAIIVVAGIEEGEFRDRADLKLPGLQEQLILAMAESQKPVIVILVGGSAITMDTWLDQVDAVLMAWYSGEQGGHALADVLMGNYSPGGKLPITFPLAVGQVPLYYNHKPTGRGDDYFDLTGEPLFPFGFGLSYTTFDFRDLRIEGVPEAHQDSVKVGFFIKNTGTTAGDEVAQVYLARHRSDIVRPVRQLIGFQRIHLNPGEEKFVEIPLPSCSFQSLDQDLKPTYEPGVYDILLGSSSRRIHLRNQIRILK